LFFFLEETKEEGNKLTDAQLRVQLLRQKQKIKATGNEVPDPISSFDELEEK